MSYKNPKVQKEYQHQWYLRKREGLPTRTKPILTEKEKRERKLKLQRKNNQLVRQRKKHIIEKALGNKCFFCDYDGRLIVHRKDGKKHIGFSNLSKQDLLKELAKNKDKYVRVCYKCHKHVHWCMEWLGMSWERLLQERERLRVQISSGP